MANKTESWLREQVANGDKMNSDDAQELLNLYLEAQTLKPRADSQISQMRKVADMLTGAAQKAVLTEIEKRESAGSDGRADDRLIEIEQRIYTLTCPTVEHGRIKGIGKALGDFRSNMENQKDEPIDLDDDDTE